MPWPSSHRFVEILYYQRLLTSGVLDPNADSIGIPISQVVIGSAALFPSFAGFLGFAFRRYRCRRRPRTADF